MIKKELNLYIICILILISMVFLVLYVTNLKHFSSIEKPVQNLLNEYFKINHEHKSSDYSEIINNSNLIEMLTLNRQRFNDSNKPKNKKYDIKINKIKKKRKNSYLVEFTLIEKRIIEKRTVNEESNYFSIIEKEDNKYYINRIITSEDSGDIKKLRKVVEDEEAYNKYLNNLINSFRKQLLDKKMKSKSILVSRVLNINLF